MIAALSFAAAIGVGLPRAFPGPCPTSRARYELRGDPAISAGFKPYSSRPKDVASDVYMFVHSRRTGSTYWFSLDWGSARIISVYPIADPEPQRTGQEPHSPMMADIQMSLWLTDGRLNFLGSELEGRDPAPKYFLVPELENNMWYGAVPREPVGTAFFVLKACANP